MFGLLMFLLRSHISMTQFDFIYQRIQNMSYMRTFFFHVKEILK